MLSLSRPVSIEIGANSVRVAQLVDGRRDLRVARFAEQDLPAGYQWEIGGDYSPLVEAIRLALSRAGIRTRRAILLLPRRQVTARVSALPPADREQLRNVVEYDLADHIPLPVDQVVADFQPLGRSLEQPGLTDVLVVAAPRDLVREYLRVLQEVGLRVDVVTVDGLVLHDLVGRAEREPAGLAVSLAIGPRATTINVSEGRRLRLTRSVAVGLSQLARAIGDDLGLDSEEAKRAMREEGMRLLTREPRPSRTAGWLESLLGEVRRSALSFGSTPISQVMLGGGALGVPGLSEAVREELHVDPVSLSAADLFRDISLEGGDAQLADRCLVAIGGALRWIGRSEGTVSLLPAEVLQGRRAALLRAAAVLGALAAIVAMAAGYAISAGRLAERQATLEVLRREEQSADDSLAASRSLLSERDRLRDQVGSLESMRTRRYAALELLRTMALYAPDDVVVTNFTMGRDRPLEVSGTAPTSATMVDFQDELGKSALVREVHLESATRDRRAAAGEAVRFTMSARLWIDPGSASGRGTRTPWERTR